MTVRVPLIHAFMFRVRVIFQCLAGTQARNPQLAANFGLLSASGKPGGSKSKPYCRAGSRCFRIRVKSLPRPAAGPGGRPTAGLRRRPWSLMPDSESPLRATVLKLLLGVTSTQLRLTLSQPASCD